MSAKRIKVDPVGVAVRKQAEVTDFYFQENAKAQERYRALEADMFELETDLASSRLRAEKAEAALADALAWECCVHGRSPNPTHPTHPTQPPGGREREARR